MPKNKGASVASALILGALALTLIFTVAGLSVNHLGVSNRLNNGQTALNMAELAATGAIEKVLHSEGKFGTEDSAEPNFFEVKPGGNGMEVLGATTLPKAWARVAFDQSQAESWEIPLSINNLGGDSPTPGFGRNVPAEAVQIVAVGECNGVKRTVEAVVFVPTYRHAVSTRGDFKTPGGLFLGGIESIDDLSDDNTVDPEELLPGHIQANGVNPDSLTLNSTQAAPVRITGNAGSVGGVVVDQHTNIEGATKPGADPIELPDIEVTDFDPGVDGAVDPGAFHPAALDVGSSVQRRDGDMIVMGELKMDEGLLYVDGNLTLKGGVNGVGAIVATGDVLIQGQGSVRGNRKTALLAEGNIDILGGGPESSVFQGVVYNKGEHVNIKNATLVGALVANGNDTAVTVEDVQLFTVETGLIEFDYSFPLKGGTGIAGFDIHSNHSLRWSKTDFEAEGQTPPPWVGEEPAWTSWWSETPIDHDLDPSTPNQPGFDLMGQGNLRFLDENTGWVVDVDPDGDGTVQTIPLLEFEDSPGNFLSRTQAKTQAEAEDPSFDFEANESKFWDDPNPKRRDILNGLKLASEVRSKTEAYEKGRFSFDPNRFFQLKDKARIMLWRTL